MQAQRIIETDGFWTSRLTERGLAIQASEIRELLKLLERTDVLSLAGGIPASELLPSSSVARISRRILGDELLAKQALQYAPSEGLPELKRWLVGYMAKQWVECDVDNILITAGSQQALECLAKLLVAPDRPVAVDVPTYLGALQAFAAYGPKYVRLESSLDASTMYCVPDFANPTGRTMSIAERTVLVERAWRSGMAIIEDAAYRDLRFEGTTLPALLALDIAKSGHIDRTQTAYCGTFSKTLSPGLRVGWVCASRDLVRKLVVVKQSLDLHSPVLNQMIVAELAKSEFVSCVDKNCEVYRKRRDAMAAALDRHMPSEFSWQVPNGGMFFWLEGSRGSNFAGCLSDVVAEARVAYVPGEAFHVDGGGRNCLRLSFSMLDEARIEEGISRLADYFRKHHTRTQPA